MSISTRIRLHALRHSFELFSVLLLAVLADFEALLVRVVPRVDANLLDILGRDHRGARREVDVGYQWNRDTALVELAANLAEHLRVAHRGRGDADDLAARPRQSLDLAGGGQTDMQFRDIDYDLGFEEAVFTERSLRNPPREWLRRPQD